MNPINSVNHREENSLVAKAADFSANAHVGQFRKYTGEPYIVHPKAVAATVSSVTEDPNIIAAAWLHDVVEDTPVTIDEIYSKFGKRCAAIVQSVTNPSKPSDGNRAARKAIDRTHLKAASAEAKTVKLADVMDNVSSVVKNDPKFAKVYLREKRALLPLLQDGHPELFTKAEQILQEAERELVSCAVRNINSRGVRSQIGRETIEIVQRGWYETAIGKRIEIAGRVNDCLTATRIYEPSELDDLLDLSLPANHNTDFIVANETSLSAAHRLVVEHGQVNTMCLNFASAKNPGGGFLGGSQAQEESLARSSALYASLLTQSRFYESNRSCGTTLYTDHMILSPNVPVFHDDDGNLLSEPYPLTFVTAPAVNAGAVRKNQSESVPLIRPTMARRIEKVLAISAHHGCENLVLGAWGCGVFRNEPSEIAELFSIALLTDARFRNRFKRITFAVLDSTADNRIIKPFLSHFGD